MLRTLAFSLSAFVAASALASADLLVFGQSRNAEFVDPGTRATFTAFVQNRGPDPAINLRLRLPLPPQSRLESLTITGGWTCSGTDTEVNCTLPALAVNRPGESATGVTATVTLSSDPNGQISTGFATVTSDTPDPNPLTNETGLQTITIC